MKNKKINRNKAFIQRKFTGMPYSVQKYVPDIL